MCDSVRLLYLLTYLRDERHRVEVAVHALGEADLVRGGGDGLWRRAVPARCRASPAEDACVREEAVCTGGGGDGGGGDGGGGWR